MSSPTPKYYTDVLRHLLRLVSSPMLERSGLLKRLPVWESPVVHSATGDLDEDQTRIDMEKIEGHWSSYEELLRNWTFNAAGRDKLERQIGITIENLRPANINPIDPLISGAIFKHIYTDNRAIWRLFYLLESKGLDYKPKEDIDYRHLWSVLREVYRIQAYASRQNPTAAYKDFDRIKSAEASWNYRILARHFEFVFHQGRTGSYAKQVRMWKKGIRADLPWIDLKLYQSPLRLSTSIRYARIDRLMIMKWGLDLIIFTERDIKDLTEFLVSYSGYMSYTDEYARLSLKGNAQNSYINARNRLKQILIEDARIASDDFELSNRVGTHFETLLSLYLAKKASDGVVDNYSVMVGKFRKKGLDKFSHPELALEVGQHLAFKEYYDLLHIYKCIPYPYYCPFYVVDRQYRLHHSLNSVGGEQGTEAAEYWQLMAPMLKFTFIQDFYEKFNYWPGKIKENIAHSKWHDTYHTSGISVEFWRECEEVDLTGCLPFLKSNEMYVSRLPDTASAPKYDMYFRSQEAYRNCPKYHKQNLMHILCDPEPIHEEKLWEDLRANNLTYSRYIATGIRSERHKFDGRVFFLMNTPYKVCYSTLEQNIRTFVDGQAGIMIGKSNKSKMIEMADMYLLRNTGTHNLFISMDMDKWSPQMARELQELQHKHWAEVFNEPGIINLGKVIQNAIFYFRIGRTFRKYENPGADLEGIRGTMLTYMHKSVCRLYVRTGREMGLTVGTASFLTLIDDALLRVGVEHGDHWNERAKIAFDHICKVYSSVGLRISLDKTYVSRTLYVMLNDLYVVGIKIHAGVKAFVKLGNYEKGPADSFSDINNAHAATATGAIKAGANISLAYAFYVYETLRQAYIWAERSMKAFRHVEAGLYALCATSLGGLGIVPMAALVGNVSGPTFARSIGMLRVWAHYEPPNALIANNIINQPVAILSDLEFLRDPTQVHVVGKRILTQRLKSACLESARRLATNQVLRDLLDFGDDAFYSELASKLRSRETISALEVRCEWEKTKRAKAESILSKFSRSDAVIELVGIRALKKIRSQNRLDVAESCYVFRRRLAGVYD
jgi:hypothetical protein